MMNVKSNNVDIEYRAILPYNTPKINTSPPPRVIPVRVGTIKPKTPRINTSPPPRVIPVRVGTIPPIKQQYRAIRGSGSRLSFAQKGKPVSKSKIVSKPKVVARPNTFASRNKYAPAPVNKLPIRQQLPIRQPPSPPPVKATLPPIQVTPMYTPPVAATQPPYYPDEVVADNQPQQPNNQPQQPSNNNPYPAEDNIPYPDDETGESGEFEEEEW